MRLTRNRGSKRLRLRQGNGRFSRSTIRNTFGLNLIVCAECRSFNPIPVGEEVPETCQHCEEPLRDISETSEE